MDPKFQQLRAFSHVYRLRSLTRAAEQMHLSQSAMSLLTKQLEEVWGVRLFDRTSRTLEPTEAAHEAIAVVERMLRDADALRTSLGDIAARRRGNLAFACTPSLAANVMPAVLMDFRRACPLVKVSVRDATPDHIFELLLGEHVEFGVLSYGGDRSDVNFETLVADQLCLICREDSALAGRSDLTWQDIVHQDLIAMNAASGLQQAIRQALEQNNLAMEPAYNVTYFTTALSMTAQGLGVVVMPRHLARSDLTQRRLVALPLHDPLVPRNLYLATKKGHTLSPAASVLVEALKAQVAANH